MQATLRDIRNDLNSANVDWEPIFQDDDTAPPPDEDVDDEDLLAEIRAEVGAFQMQPL